MLSSMTDKLRETASELERIENEKANCRWYDKMNGWYDSTTQMDAVRKLRDAADVIDELRCTCNDMQRDNDGLRRLVHDMWRTARHSIDCEECCYYDSCRGYPCTFHEWMSELGCSDERR